MAYASHGKNYTVNSAPYTNIYGDELINRTDIKVRLKYLEMPLIAKFTLFSSQKVTFDMATGRLLGIR